MTEISKKSPVSSVRKTVHARKNLIHDRLQTGNIILTFTAGYMSNVFLPRNFKHGITYIGTPEERRATGLNDQSPNSDDFQAVISERAQGLSALYDLMNVQRPNI